MYNCIISTYHKSCNCVFISGENSSGKSSIINQILRRNSTSSIWKSQIIKPLTTSIAMAEKTNLSDSFHLETKEDEKMIKAFSKEHADMSSSTRRFTYQIEEVGLLFSSFNLKFYETSWCN